MLGRVIGISLVALTGVAVVGVPILVLSPTRVTDEREDRKTRYESLKQQWHGTLNERNQLRD